MERILLEKEIKEKLLNIELSAEAIKELFRNSNIELDINSELSSYLNAPSQYNDIKYQFVNCDIKKTNAYLIPIDIFDNICLYSKDVKHIIENKNGIVEKYYLGTDYHRYNAPAIIKYYRPKLPFSEEYLQYGKLYREDGGPTIINYHNGIKSEECWYATIENGYKFKEGLYNILYFEDGTIREESWYGGCDDKCSNVKYYSDGTIREKSWYSRDDGGPTNVKYYPDGSKTESWPTNIKYYPDGPRNELLPYHIGPVVIKYYPDGSKSEETLQYRNTHIIIKYYPDGTVKSEEHYSDNKKHRVDGPAIVEFNKDGKCIKAVKWLKGKRKPEDYDLKTIVPYNVPSKLLKAEDADEDKVYTEDIGDIDFDPLS